MTAPDTLDINDIFNMNGIKSVVQSRLRREKLPLYFAKSLGNRVYILGVNKDGALITHSVDLGEFNTVIENFTGEDRAGL